MNPMSMLKLRPLLEAFRENHPKIPMFLSAASDAIDEGSIVEMKITTSNGKNIVTNFLVNPQDVELLNELKKILANQ